MFFILVEISITWGLANAIISSVKAIILKILRIGSIIVINDFDSENAAELEKFKILDLYFLVYEYHKANNGISTNNHKNSIFKNSIFKIIFVGF